LSLADLEARIDRLAAEPDPPPAAARAAVQELLDALERGIARAAEPLPEGSWRVHAWIKRGILLGFRTSGLEESHVPPTFHFRDRTAFPPQDAVTAFPRSRVVPGGTAVRRGAFLAADVVVMPPSYVNVGAWVGPGSMIDSHALVGSCAQLGARVHLSAAAQIGGVLEPVGAWPVIVEDDAFIGGGCGVYEGTRIGRGAVLAAGVVLTRSVPVFDLVREAVYRAVADGPLVIPDGAVIVPGSRPAAGAFAGRLGLSLHAPMVVKYREPGTHAALALETALR
jgi:2,3,4,5-tetrahydropyridine-2-carboxylate N-succinyltransferase